MNYFIWTSKAQEKCSLGVMVKGGLSNFGFHLFMVLENHDWQKHFLFYCFKLMISSYVPKALELNRTSLCHFKKDQVHTQGPWGTSGQFRHHPASPQPTQGAAPASLQPLSSSQNIQVPCPHIVLLILLSLSSNAVQLPEKKCCPPIFAFLPST